MGVGGGEGVRFGSSSLCLFGIVLSAMATVVLFGVLEFGGSLGFEGWCGMVGWLGPRHVIGNLTLTLECSDGVRGFIKFRVISPDYPGKSAGSGFGLLKKKPLGNTKRAMI